MTPRDYAQLLDRALEDKNEGTQDQILLRFKNILTKNKDTYIAQTIKKEFQKVQNEKKQKKTTYLSSASQLSSIQEQQLKNIFPAPWVFSVNPSLLGGVAVRQNDTLFNGTLRKKVELLKSSL